MQNNTYDYIVIGGGSAGCTIAGNLIDRAKGTVLLLEAGGMDSSLFIKMPGGVGKAIPNHIWDYASDPSPALGAAWCPCRKGAFWAARPR
jgi:choline dehydrogenase